MADTYIVRLVKAGKTHGKLGPYRSFDAAKADAQALADTAGASVKVYVEVAGVGSVGPAVKRKAARKKNPHLKPGDRVMVDGYEGTVLRDVGHDSYEVRMPGGIAVKALGGVQPLRGSGAANGRKSPGRKKNPPGSANVARKLTEYAASIGFPVKVDVFGPTGAKYTAFWNGVAVFTFGTQAEGKREIDHNRRLYGDKWKRNPRTPGTRSHRALPPRQERGHRRDCATNIDHALRCTCARERDLDANRRRALAETPPPPRGWPSTARKKNSGKRFLEIPVGSTVKWSKSHIDGVSGDATRIHGAASARKTKIRLAAERFKVVDSRVAGRGNGYGYVLLGPGGHFPADDDQIVVARPRKKKNPGKKRAPSAYNLFVARRMKEHGETMAEAVAAWKRR